MTATDERGRERQLEAAKAEWREYVKDAKRVYLVGNGGSCAVVGHAETDLVKACRKPAMALLNASTLTAYANDDGYAHAYAHWLRDLAIADRDMLIAVSSSGASENILNACEVATKAGAVVVTCSGFTEDNPLRQLGDLNFYVPSSDYGHVELTHATLLHELTDALAHA